MPLRVLFFGTPAFAVPSLERLLAAGHAVVGVVTQPDRPRGRGHQLAPSAVKLRALELGLPVCQPTRLRDPETLTAFEAERTDVAVVAAYGRLLPQALLDLPRLGFVNVHASLLPRWRGAAPIHRAILAGDRETGVTIMRVVLALDAGPMLAREITPIDPEETSEALEARLATLGADLLVKALPEIETGTARATAQDNALVTYAAKIERRDAPVDWRRPATDLHNQIRGLQPWPLATTRLGATRLLLHRSRVDGRATPTAAPGTIVETGSETLVVACGSGALRVVELQPEGRRPMSAGAFLRGHRVEVGAVFDGPPP